MEVELPNGGANLLRRYNPGVDFSAGRGIVYVPRKDQNETFVPFKSSKGGLTLMLAFVHLLHMRFKEAHEIFGNVDDLLKRRKQGLTEMSGFDDPPGRRNELRNIA
ncbi:hypothetical protein AgCh_025571 [Apium graveolens]